MQIETTLRQFLALGWTKQVPLPSMEFNSTATELFQLAVFYRPKENDKSILQLFENRAEGDHDWRPVVELLKAQDAMMAEFVWTYNRRYNMETVFPESLIISLLCTFCFFFGVMLPK